MTEEERQRILKDGFDQFKKLASADDPVQQGLFDELIARIMRLNQEVKDQIRPILAAGGGKDPKALEKMVHDLYSFAFAKFSKGELEEICAWMLTSTAMEGIFPTKLGVKPKL